MSFPFIRQYGLQPGQWVMFSLPEVADLLGPFRVISRTDPEYNSCKCVLAMLNGTTFDYCPRLRRLGNDTLPQGYRVVHIDRIDPATRLGQLIMAAESVATRVLPGRVTAV